jgi:AcrR family transcriptional regulator
MTNTRSKEDLVEEFRVQSIQQAAMRVIGRKGTSAATMSDVAEEAGVAKGTIYLYFANREELFRKTADYALSQLDVRLQTALASVERFDRRLHLLLHTVMAFFDEHQELFRIFLELGHGDGYEGASCGNDDPRYQEHVAELARFITRGIDEGSVQALDAERVSLFMIEGINAVIKRRVTEQSPPPLDRDVDFITAVILNGISKKRSRS